MSQATIAVEAETPVEPRVVVAGQWTLFWWKFRKHRVAVAGGVVIVLLYLVGAFADFLAPFPADLPNTRYTYAPPQTLHWFQDGNFSPHVLGYTVRIDPEAMRRVFVEDSRQVVPVRFLADGAPYMLWGLIPSRIHLFGVEKPGQPLFLLGADRLGRDMLSRVIYATRISLSIGLVGVAMSLGLGVLLGGVSGYFGGTVDTIIQRVIEFVRSVPTIPLWMGMAAAVPTSWPPLRTYFMITLIISLIGWTSLAREVRGKFLVLRNEDFITAARLDGLSDLAIIYRHMVPSFLSHIIAAVTLAIPGMILAETSLSFLGIGLQPPIVSWGVLLQEAQNIRAVASAPWLLFAPGIAVVTAVLALNFLGDGLRDAADPYA
jgi:peptide/nickel transport system permease protein